MGHAYIALLEDRHALLFQMQSYAACSDPAIQARVRERYGELVKLVTARLRRRAGGRLAVLLARDAAQRRGRARPRTPSRTTSRGRALVRARRADPHGQGLTLFFSPGQSNRSQPVSGAFPMLDRLARLLYRRRRAVLAGAVLLVLIAGAVGGPVAGLLKSDDDFDPPCAESVQAREAIGARHRRLGVAGRDRARAAGRPGRLGRRPAQARSRSWRPPADPRWRAWTPTARAARASSCRATAARPTSRSACATAPTPTRTIDRLERVPGVVAGRAAS